MPLTFISDLIYISGLWKLMKKPINFLGSIHVFKHELYSKIDRKILKAFDSSEIVYFENFSTFPEPFKLSFIKLKDRVSEEDFNEINQILFDNDLRIEHYEYYRPFSLTSEIRDIVTIREGCRDYYEDGIDNYFLIECFKWGKNFKGLGSQNYHASYIEDNLTELEMRYYLIERLRSSFEHGKERKDHVD